jgi:hypothetical protein
MGAQQRYEVGYDLCAHDMQVDPDPELGQAAPDQVMLAQQAVDLARVDRAKCGQHVALFKLQVCGQPSVEVRPEPGSVFARIRVKGGAQLAEESVEPLVVADELAAQAGVPQK